MELLSAAEDKFIAAEKAGGILARLGFPISCVDVFSSRLKKIHPHFIFPRWHLAFCDGHYRLVVDGGCIARRRNAVSLHFVAVQNDGSRGFLFVTKAIKHFACNLSPLWCAKRTRGSFDGLPRRWPQWVA